MRDSAGCRTSFFGLVKQLTQEVKTFVKEEARLAKTELAEKFAQLGRNAKPVAIGGFVAYAGLIVLLLAIGLLAGFAFEQLGLETLLAGAAGLGAVALLVLVIGVAFVLKGLKAFSRESLAPQRTIETLQNLKGEAARQEPPPKEEKRTSQEIEESVLETEDRMAETLEELERRITLRHLRRKAQQEISSHPYRWGLVAVGTGLAGSFFLRRKRHRLKG